MMRSHDPAFMLGRVHGDSLAVQSCRKNHGVNVTFALTFDVAYATGMMMKMDYTVLRDECERLSRVRFFLE